MTLKEKDAFLKVLSEMAVPDEYFSNISRCVQTKQRNIIGLKTYDCHILMQELFLVAIRGSLPKKVASVLIDLCHLFKCLCSKVLVVSELEKLQEQAALILYEMEKMFPPSFFTIMVHLVIHLVEEARTGGPVFYRWMYPIERFLLTLKNLVKNRAHPEASVAEGYVANECLTLCSRYLSGVERKFDRPIRNGIEEYIYDKKDADLLPVPLGRPLGKKGKSKHFVLKKRKRGSTKKLDEMSLAQAHRYVLFNTKSVDLFREEHKRLLKNRHCSRRLSMYQLDRKHSLEFPDWFRKRFQCWKSKVVHW